MNFLWTPVMHPLVSMDNKHPSVHKFCSFFTGRASPPLWENPPWPHQAIIVLASSGSPNHCFISYSLIPLRTGGTRRDSHLVSLPDWHPGAELDWAEWSQEQDPDWGLGRPGLQPWLLEKWAIPGSSPGLMKGSPDCPSHMGILCNTLTPCCSQ